MTANDTVEQTGLCETHAAYRLALLHSTCSVKPTIWSQSYPRKHTNCITPSSRTFFPRFRHLYVMQKHSHCIKIE